MAIYHLSVKTVSRSAGRSATAAAAYRAGVKITDQRTGEVHDYTRRSGVECAELVLPAGAPDWAADRAALWNAAEQAETRKNSTVAREFEIALPDELSPAERLRLVRDLALEIVERHGCALDVVIHAPSKKGDNRNHHAHILLSTRRLGPAGFMEKTRELDDQKSGEVQHWRKRFASLQNERLHEAGIEARVDHRSHAERELLDVPGSHHGPAVNEILRKGGSSDVADRVAAEAAALIARQVLDAQASAELLEAQAAQALADLEAELEIERVQALREAAEAAEAAERLQAAQAQAQAQARAAERAAEAAQAAERALAVQEAAQRDVDAAERARQALWPAYDAVMTEQRQAGESLFASAMAIPKIAAWQRAIEAYEKALGVLAKAQAVLAKAGERLTAALDRLEALDPAVRERREARERASRRAYDDQQRRIAEASSAAAAQATAGRRRGQVAVQSSGHQDDQEPDSPAPHG